MMRRGLVTTETVNPEMIVLARESRGLTQSELAEAVGVSQGIISRYESGMRSIGGDELKAIAEALEYPGSFFYQSGRRYGLGSSGLYHRKRKTLPARSLDMLIAKANTLRLVVDRLLDGVEIERTQKFPQYDVDDFKGDIERIAELVRAAWKLPAGPVVDLVGAIENAGGIVHRTSFGTQKMDALVQWVPPSPPIFLVNDAIPGDRLRFTLAHEIAHLVMHDIPRDTMEEEADTFAAAFLMPANDILPSFSKVNLPRLAQLKPYWRVSIAALIRRARDLGAITDRQYRSLYEELGRLGYRVEEPVPIPLEKPTLLQEIIEAHLTELNYGVGELSEMLSLMETEFRNEYLATTNHLRVVKPVAKPSSRSPRKH